MFTDLDENLFETLIEKKVKEAFLRIKPYPFCKTTEEASAFNKTKKKIQKDSLDKCLKNIEKEKEKDYNSVKERMNLNLTVLAMCSICARDFKLNEDVVNISKNIEKQFTLIINCETKKKKIVDEVLI